MTKFSYTAKAETGKRAEGIITADSITSAAQDLRAGGLFPVRIEPQSSAGKMSCVFERLGLNKFNIGKLAQFTDQFAGLLEAGIPLERALRLLESQTASPLLKTALQEITESVFKGKSLAEAMSGYPKIFSATYVSMIKVGEEAGLLADMLRRLSKSLDEEYQLRGRLKAAMVYPVFLTLVGLGTVIVLMVWVIPKFSSFFTSVEHQLPLPTRIVISTSSALARVWPLVLFVSLLIILSGIRLLKNKNVRFALDRFCLHIPVVGNFIIKSQMVQLMRTLGILLSHGVNILGALNIAGETLSNKFIAAQVYQAKDKAAMGEKLQDCFTDDRVFSSAVLSVIAIGQECGTMPQMLIRLGEQYEQQTQRQIKALTGIIEPVMILLMGSIVGFVVVSMLMPIFKVSSLVR
ncbi:MAG: hypothetical protein GWO86_01285 [Planctomycetes bacterium]|nr:hypothetical protein [Planctomycetota bacterium]